MLALNGGRPELMNLREVLEAFVEFREEVITRRTIYELGKARERAHILVGLAIAVASIDPVIELIRRAKDPEEARAALTGRAWPAGDVAPLIALLDEPGHKVDEEDNYRLSDAQARAILELRLQRLTGLEREKIDQELQDLTEKIKDYLAILESRERLLEVLREELAEIKERYADPRRTSIEEGEFEQDIEDLIPREEMVVTVSHNGYIKRVPLSTYRAQARGGKGRSGMSTREGDFVSSIFVCDTHTPVLFFSSRGMVYKMKVYKLPLGAPQARGKPLVNLLPLEQGESITTWMALPEDESLWESMFVMFATSQGTVRRNKLSDFTNVMANGKIAMKLEDDSRLVSAQVCGEDDDVLLATAAGKCIRFAVPDVRVFAGRNSIGVRGIRLAKGDRVISMSILKHLEISTEERDAYLRAASSLRRQDGEESEQPCAPENLGAELSPERFEELAAAEQFILSVAGDGLGKRTSAYEYRITGRGGQGIGNLDLSRAKGAQVSVVGAFPVGAGDEIVLVTDGGQLIRTPVADIRIAGRTTRGVKLFRVAEGERVISVAHLAETVEDQNGGEDGEESEADAAPDEPGKDGEE
jgi:DNA gyrase subunit A